VTTSMTSSSNAMLQTNRSVPKRVRARRFCLSFVFYSIIVAVAVALLTVWIDPLQFYHKATWYNARFSTEERYQNPGLAKNFDYDTIIIGTSMTENFVPSQVGEQLGGKVMKLSMEGSISEEHYQMARLALSTGKVKKVLWGLDYFSLKSKAADSNYELPKYMYDDKWWNDYPYWFNYTVYEQFFKSVMLQLKGTPKQNLDYLSNWNWMVTFGKERVAKAYDKANAEEGYFGLDEEAPESLKVNFDHNILSLVKDHPDVEFIFYYPPYSVLRQVVWYNTNPTRFGYQIEMRKWMYEQFAQYPNVKLYDFQTADWTYDLDLYKDLSHHHMNVNKWIAEAIGKDDPKYRVTDDNVDALNDSLIAAAENAVMTPEYEVVNFSTLLSGQKHVFTGRLLQEDGKDLLVPVKQLVSELGAELTWDQATKTAVLKRGDRELRLTMGSTDAVSSGQTVKLEYAPRLIGGTSLVPLGFVAGELGYKTELSQLEDGTTQLSITE